MQVFLRDWEETVCVEADPHLGNLSRSVIVFWMSTFFFLECISASRIEFV